MSSPNRKSLTINKMFENGRFTYRVTGADHDKYMDNFLMVGSHGDPDISEAPKAVSIVEVSALGVQYIRSRAAAPVVETMTRYQQAHEVAVQPVHDFLERREQPAVHVARAERPQVAMINILSKSYGSLALHAMYEGEGDEPAPSALFVGRMIIDTNDPEEIRKDEPEFDLPKLIDKELGGEPTRLRCPGSVPARALGAVSLLVDTDELTAGIRSYKAQMNAIPGFVSPPSKL